VAPATPTTSSRCGSAWPPATTRAPAPCSRM
jgi:hypothetical protein